MAINWKCAAFCLFVACGIAVLQSSLFKCWIDGGSSVIESQCEMEKVVGNKCHVVCSAWNKDCHLYHASKDLVRVIEAEDALVVLKHKDIPMLTNDYTQSLLPLDHEDKQQEAFQDLLHGMVTFELHDKYKQDLLNLLWPWHNASSLFMKHNRPVLEQIVRFAHNDEYKLMQLHQKLQLFPAVVGTCGDVYVVEHVALLLDRPFLDLIPAFADVCHVVQSAGHILSYLLHLSSVLPLHLCDLQWGHFGTDGSGRVRFVDLDAAFTPAKMAATQTETPCADDTDCDFFDCRGSCDAEAGRCRAEVSDNVSNLCRQLVWPRAPLLGAEQRLGLLGAVLSDQQALLLERCAHSRNAQHAEEVVEMLAALEHKLC